MKLTAKLLIGAAILMAGTISLEANIPQRKIVTAPACCIPPLCPPCDFGPSLAKK